ncbi:MAG: hypothetical protein HW380_1443 [Magnetococcales bacterium]|nr:hypothetical protein [Magnetococcales bacterium]HIJ85660.1 hypothetical protein [Magnetococcales bacterium]
MISIFPYTLHEDSGSFFISFPDVPGALTGDDSEEATKAGALDCLTTALEALMDLKRPIPPPGQPIKDQWVVTLPPLIAAKVVLYEEMRARAVTRVEMARRLGVTENAVRRLLDLRHQSHIGQIETALAILGKRLVVTIQDAA